RRLTLPALAIGGVVLVVLPLARPGAAVSLLVTVLTLTLMAQAWSLPGARGWPDLGSAGFFGLGAYATAILMARLNLPLGVALVGGGLAGGLLALLPALGWARYGAAFLAAATLATSQALREIASHATRLTGGDAGLSVPLTQAAPL